MNRNLCMVGGAANLLFAAFHLTFPWLFRWNTELTTVSSVNRATVYTLHTAVVLVLLLFAYVSLVHWHELLTTGLGSAVTLAICLLWLIRTIAELVAYRIGIDGAWWRVAVFLAIFAIYLAALLAARPLRLATVGR